MQSNDDGLTEKDTRVLGDALMTVGSNVMSSAPIYNRSGRGEF